MSQKHNGGKKRDYENKQFGSLYFEKGKKNFKILNFSLQRMAFDRKRVLRQGLNKGKISELFLDTQVPVYGSLGIHGLPVKNTRFKAIYKI